MDNPGHFLSLLWLIHSKSCPLFPQLIVIYFQLILSENKLASGKVCFALAEAGMYNSRLAV